MTFQTVACSFCKGKGTDPFGLLSWESKCCVCSGDGEVSVFSPNTKCAHCEGSGAIKRFTCTVCKGKGLVPKPPKPTTTCPKCQGSGDDFSNGHLSCLTCKGCGWITQ